MSALPNKQCEGITAKGVRCTRKCSEGSDFCWQHKSQNKIVERRPIDWRILNQAVVDTKVEEVKNIKSETNFSLSSEIKQEIKILDSIDDTKIFHKKSDNIASIKKVVSLVYPGITYDSEGLNFVNELTYPLYLKLIYTSSIDELQKKINDLFVGELSKYARSEIRIALNNGTTSIEILQTVAIEYIIAEISKLAKNLTEINERKKINFYFINEAICTDIELYPLFEGKVMKDKFFRNYEKINLSLVAIKKIFITTHQVKITENLIRFIKTGYLPAIYKSHTTEEISVTKYSSYFDYANDLAAKMKSENPSNILIFLNDTDLINDKLVIYRQEVIKMVSEEMIPDLVNNILAGYL